MYMHGNNNPLFSNLFTYIFVRCFQFIKLNVSNYIIIFLFITVLINNLN